MFRRQRHEDHVNHEAWAIPYADLLTLLLAFFVVMYAVSSVNEGKYRVVSEALSAAFRGAPTTPQPIPLSDARSGIVEQMPSSQLNRLFGAALPSQSLNPLPAADPVKHDQSAAQSSDVHRPATEARVTKAEPLPGDTLSQVAAGVTTAMASLIHDGQVNVHQYPNWVAVDISADVLFASGQARLSPAATDALQRLAEALKPYPNSLRVEGHTDDRPIDTTAFPSNWELSAARAASVVHLFMDRGLAPERMAVVGFGQYQPVTANSSAQGRNANRRVVVVILGKDSAPEARL
jgi:chemotaxis protein MotB